MKKEKLIGLTALTAAAVATIAPMKAEARPGFGGPHHHFPHHHYGFWGHGGRHFWPGFVGGVVGGAIWGGYRSYPIYTTPVYTAPVYTAPVYTAPVVVQQPQPIYQQPVQQQPVYQAPAAQPQPTEVKVVVEHRYLTAEEAARAASAAQQNQKQ